MSDKWKILESNYIVNDRWLKLRADKAETAEGHIVEPYYVSEFPEWINCLVIDKNNNVLLHNHYRHGIQGYVLEILAGVVEEGETPKEAIERELMEELGYSDGTLHEICTSFSNPANQSNKVYSFLAVGGEVTQEAPLEASETLTTIKLPAGEAFRRLTSLDTKEVFQALHLVNVFSSLRFIKKSTDPTLESLRHELGDF